ncbi:hypothetical protein [Salinimicrobium oceani]|uniref:Uncharacterized protein n=1 Tax=Salinimicrobium oceani TaxID=2722702 RepID=A0ABX1CXX2_9FLAO|nr:hypothetical protein [Salinimicrobium oceani]NJW52785.1 hypothetical protein [Salinimicrobium oceani]
MKKNGLPYRSDSGMKVPENYFQDFESRMMTRLNISKGEAVENPFKVPAAYFEDLEKKVFVKLEQEASEKGKVIPLFNRRLLSYVASIAAVLAILLASVVFNSSREIGFEDLDMVAVENYLLESLDLENPNESPIDEYNYTASANPNIDKEALLEYLNDHIEEPALLLNED